ncbi:hypothetical protein XELAEV_18047039mg [Xenopus laevis]|uniref:Secreted protein n=1 Tax=Xenopus laevis TaxID=8355 RepID=A0A974BUB4_XENLA|nr:hypothetical protein XELAEV_18047039mg [Xenopus laevis]
MFILKILWSLFTYCHNSLFFHRYEQSGDREKIILSAKVENNSLTLRNCCLKTKDMGVICRDIMNQGKSQSHMKDLIFYCLV